MRWRLETDLQIGLGCMRLSTDLDRDEGRARATIHTALDEGLTIYDTAHAYGHDETEYGHNERWLGRFLSEHPRGATARVITKGGMRRAGLKWIPDGRASTLRSQCEASREALGRPIDLYLLHVPDSKTPLATSVRALESLRDEGLVRAIGLSNVTRAQLDEALSLTEISAVQVAMSLLDDNAIRGGVIAGALERDVTVICHSPLGGPKKYTSLGTQPWLLEKARAAECTPYEWALASLINLSPNVVVIPGARRPETVRSARKAQRLSIPSATPEPKPETSEGEVLLLMGLQGSGKTTAVRAAVNDGYARLNRDEAGTTLEKLHAKLGTLLLGGTKRVVLDNTYVTRAHRNGAISVAQKHGVPVRGVWHDIETEQAQVNIVNRMLDVHGRLLSPEELVKGRTPDSLPPRGLHSTVRMLDANGTWLPLAREAIDAHPDRVKVLVGWREGGVTPPPGIENAVCPHAGGPPVCWCRPPLPGGVLERARALGLGLARSQFITTSSTLAVIGRALGLTAK